MSTTTEHALRNAQRLRPRIASRASAHDVEARFPEEDFDDLRDAGLLALMVPERLGGCGAGFADYVEIAMEIAKGNGSTALLFNMHSSIMGALALASDDVARLLGASETSFPARDRVLCSAAEGSFFAVAMSERRAGARLSLMETSYTPVDSGFHIRGSKTFVSGAGHANGYLVAARSSDVDEPDVSYFLIPAGDGLTVEETWDSLGMRATGSHDLHIDTIVGEESLLGGVQGLAISLAQAMPQWLVASYSAVYAGVARSVVDATVAHVKERNTLGLPAVRSAIGRADAAVCSAELVVREAARRIDNAAGETETNQWVYRAKLIAGDTAMHVAASLLEAAGTSAMRRGHPLERLYRDARCGALQPATSSVCADWLGVSALGESPDVLTDAPRW